MALRLAWMHVLHPWVVALLTLLAASISAQPCPGLDVITYKLALRPNVGNGKGVPTVRAGGRIDALVALKNAGTSEVSQVGVRVHLPEYVVPKKTSTWPPLAKQAVKLPFVEDVRNLYWTDLTLLPGKTRKFRVKAWVPACQNTSSITAVLAVEVAAYVAAEDGLGVTCLIEASPATFRVAPALKLKGPLSSKVCTPVSPPDPIPVGAGYRFYASNQGFTESVLAPLRRRMTAAGETDDRHHQRGLSPTTNPTREECKSPARSCFCVQSVTTKAPSLLSPHRLHVLLPHVQFVTTVLLSNDPDVADDRGLLLRPYW